jgi:hypothetical protein
MRKATVVAWMMGVALAVSPGAVRAAQAQLALAGGSERVRSGVEPAELEARAEALFAAPKKYGQAVKLYVQAADLREPGDPQRVTDLVMASRLAFYDGKKGRASDLMVRAADEALAAGDIVNAAHAYIDASFLAQEMGNGAVVVELVKKAQLLTASPLIARTDRTAILARITA